MASPLPRLSIDLRRFEENVRHEVALLARYGVTVMGVNKVFSGLRETAEAQFRGGIEVVAESRISCLKQWADLPGRKCLLRSPALSEIAETIRYADISLNSEPAVLRALSAEAVRQQKQHDVLLMVDCGDLREGVWFADEDGLEAVLRELLGLPGLGLYGLGTNFNCFGGIKPTLENGTAFVALARRLEARLGIEFPYLSGGNCTSFTLIEKGTWPAGINHLRIGGLHQFGIEYVDMHYVEGFHHSQMPVERAVSDLYKLEAEIIELSTKPTVPVGEPGVDAFLQPVVFADHGNRRRALLALGRLDVPSNNIWPVDPAVTVVGQTSDHTIVDVDAAVGRYTVGDVITFELDYTALLHACGAVGINKVSFES